MEGTSADYALALRDAARSPSRLQLRDEVIAYVRESIVSGRLSPGTRLRLASLAEQTGTSPTPVREGLLSLAHDGWVVQEVNRGFRVATLERQDVVDAYVAHAFVAGELASRAAAAINDEMVERLRELDASMRESDAGDETHVDNLNFEFHKWVYDAARSPRLIWFINAASRFVPRRFWPTIPGWLAFNAAGHQPIIAALAAHEAHEARAATSGHIHQASELLLAHLDSISFWTVAGGE